LVAHGFRWSLVSNLSARVGTLFMGIVLARLLAPDEYGVYTIAFVALMVLSNTNDLGIETALIRYPGNVDRIGPTAVTVIWASSVLQFLLAFIAAPWFARALGSPEATGVIRLLTVCVLINGAFAVQSGLLTREFQQRRRALADLVGLGLSIAVTIALAAAGLGPWSLAWGRVVGNLVNGILHFKLARARYRPAFDEAVARPLLRIGIPIALAFLFTEAVNNVDYVVVGRVLGATALGLYLMAFNLSSWPVTTLSFSITRVSVPGFARLQKDHAALQAAFARALALVLGLAALVCGVMAVLAEPLIRFVYGPPWTGAALALRFLVVLGVARVGLQLGYDLLYALGRGRSTLAIQVCWFALLIPALSYGALHDGIRGVGIAHMVVVLAVPIPGLLLALRRAGFSLQAVFALTPRPLFAAACAALAAQLVSAQMSGDFVRLVCGSAVAVAVWALIAGRSTYRLARAEHSVEPEEEEVSEEHAPLTPEQSPI
jgi:PST family polysaccharide transporter